MRKSIKTTLLLLVSLQLLVAGAYGSMENRIHTAHIGPGTANLKCDTCHGAPPNVVIQIQARNGSGPGGYIVCEQCHAPPPDSMKPGMGNLITIHLSRGTECTGCHNTDTITPSHSSNGTVIKCEKCHPAAEKSVSHENGGKYCMQCHNGTGITAIQAQLIQPTAAVTQVQPIPTSNQEQEEYETGKVAYAIGDDIATSEDIYSPQETRISRLESSVRSIIDRIVSLFR